MLDLSVIILTYNEEIHIRRCIENVRGVAQDIFVVDSISTDNTRHIAEQLGAKVYENKWQGSHAKQLNWALDNLPIHTRWVLRLDADEYLTSELLEEMTDRLQTLDANTTGVVLKRRHFFLGKWVKRGIYPVRLLRLFRYGNARCEDRLMDEYLQLNAGICVEFENDFVDNNLNPISWWVNKHVGYAIKEAAEMLNDELGLENQTNRPTNAPNMDVDKKRSQKQKYAKMPLFVRSFTYFVIRYFFKLGFLDGKQGFLWTFMQGWWYRTLVDINIYEIKKVCGTDRDKINSYLKDKYAIDFLNN